MCYKVGPYYREKKMNAAPNLKPVVQGVNMKALNYSNRRIIQRLVDEDRLCEKEAEILFADTLRFLALTERGMKLSPPAKIDLGWHTFVLHTRAYAEFCESCFGHFIHHEPGSGTTDTVNRLNLEETVELARLVFGDLSMNWSDDRGATCGSGGC